MEKGTFYLINLMNTDYWKLPDKSNTSTKYR